MHKNTCCCLVVRLVRCLLEPVLFAEATNRKRPLQALSTLDEDANSLLMSAIGEEAETEQPSSKSARHSASAGGMHSLLGVSYSPAQQKSGCNSTSQQTTLTVLVRHMILAPNPLPLAACYLQSRSRWVRLTMTSVTMPCLSCLPLSMCASPLWRAPR